MATEKRLIDADEFLKWLVKRFHCVPLVGSCDNDCESVKFLLSQAPTVDAVEVVRCKDCEYWENGKDYTPYCNHVYGMYGKAEENYFCSYGERKDNG